MHAGRSSDGEEFAPYAPFAHESGSFLAAMGISCARICIRSYRRAPSDTFWGKEKLNKCVVASDRHHTVDVTELKRTGRTRDRKFWD